MRSPGFPALSPAKAVRLRFSRPFEKAHVPAVPAYGLPTWAVALLADRAASYRLRSDCGASIANGRDPKTATTNRKEPTVSIAPISESREAFVSPVALGEFVQRGNGANADYQRQSIIYHTEQAAEATRRYYDYPEREREGGLSVAAARRRAMFVAAADAPAMLATVEAARVADPLTFVGLAIAATAFNAWLGWEIGTLARAEREPNATTGFHRLQRATLLVIAVAWLVTLFVIRANFV